MSSSSVRLGRLWDIELRLDYTLFLGIILLVYSLAVHYFPYAHPGWAMGLCWLMAAITALLFIVSVLGHELAHSLVSGAFGMPAHDITLYIFGGVTQIHKEPRTPHAELWMALAGPVTSALLAGLFGLIWLLTPVVAPLLNALAGWLAQINLLMALFNLLPGFPLDGGRVLRAIIWGLTGSLRRATRVASRLGQIIAFAMILGGIWLVFRGAWANGLWVAFLGWFLSDAARSSYEQLRIREALAGHSAREAMLIDCPAVPRRLSLDAIVEHIARPYGRRYFSVEEAGQVQGLLTLAAIQRVPPSDWPATRAEDVMIPREQLKRIDPAEKLDIVLDRLVEGEVNPLPVFENGLLLGVVAWDNLLAFASDMVNTNGER